jgi:hypothetical protein
MHVRPSHAGETGAARSASAAAATSEPKGTGGAAFAALLAKASSAPTASAPATTNGPAATTPATDAATPHAIRLRVGEAATAVAGQAYLEIHGGRRDGMFINTSANKRYGKAFTLVHKNGHELHVYGSGKDRVVVRVSGVPHDPAHPPAPVRLRAGETMTKIPGHHYAQINGGPRDGLMINLTRGKRRGETFALVHKDGETYHVYGSGKHRTVIQEVGYDWGHLAHAASPITVITRAHEGDAGVSSVIGGAS